jgi:hypothetical protein
MVSVPQKPSCPFCGVFVDLERLPIVATTTVRRGGENGGDPGQAPWRQFAPAGSLDQPVTSHDDEDPVLWPALGEDYDLDEGGADDGHVRSPRDRVLKAKRVREAVRENRPAGASGQTTGAAQRPSRGSPVLPSGSPILGWVGEWPVVRRAEPENRSGSESVAGSLRKLLQPGDVIKPGAPEDLPARVCLSCRHPLPDDLATRKVYTVAVVGTVRAGKSHYLAAMARDASRRGGLAEFGVSEFAPDEPTSVTYQTDYYRPVFRDKQVLPRTNPNPGLLTW